jgi:D-sedoheptulose 7-phosphate isomerase
MNYLRRAKKVGRLLDEFFESRAEAISKARAALLRCLESGHKILVFGNGGSAAEAQHFAAELVNRYARSRRAIPALAITTDTSVLTSIGNDLSFSAVFSRQVEALGCPGDLALGISTSGNSSNVIRALKSARRRDMTTLGLSGAGGGKMAPHCDFLLDVPSSETPLVQEVHLVILHILAEEIEARVIARPLGRGNPTPSSRAGQRPAWRSPQRGIAGR